MLVTGETLWCPDCRHEVHYEDVAQLDLAQLAADTADVHHDLQVKYAEEGYHD